MSTLSFWEIIFAPYVTGPVGAVCGVAYKHWRAKYWDMRGARRTLGFLRSPTSLYVPGYRHDSARGIASGYGDMLAFSELYSAASRLGLSAGLQAATTASGQLTQFERQQNLVILGGGTANIHHIALIEALRCPLHFWDTAVSDNKTIRDESGRIQVSPEVRDNRVLSDVGLLIYAPNPFNPSATVVLCAGAFTYGTAAAMSHLLSKEGRKEIDLSKGHGVAIAVTCDVVDHRPANIHQPVKPLYGPWH